MLWRVEGITKGKDIRKLDSDDISVPDSKEEGILVDVIANARKGHNITFSFIQYLWSILVDII